MLTENQTLTTKATHTNVDKHVQFWDRKNKGYITPVDTVFGFIHLGYGIVISVTLGTFIGMLLSYSTQDSWIPDPLCRTRVEKWRRKNTSGQLYGEDGKLDLELFDKQFMKYAKSDISGKSVTIKELLEWNEATYKEPLAWSSTALEWFAIYLLVGNKGVVKKQDIQAVYDGTLFYQLRDRNKTSRSIQGLGNGNSSSSSSSSTISISGVKVPKSYIQQLETQLNKVIHTLPHPTVSVLETRLRHWLSFTQQQQQQVTIIHNSNTNNTMNPILKGVMTPDPVRRTLFSGSSRGGGGNETTQDSLFVDHDNGLTGVITADKVEQTISLAGVQGYEYSANDDDVTGDGSTLDSKHGVEISDQMALSVMDNEHGSDYNDGLSFSMAGIRSEEKEETDWLYSGQLTGVSPSPSLNLADYQDSDKTNGGSSNDNKDGAMLESESLDDTHSVATPSLIDNGSTASDLDDPYDDNSTREIHSQESKNTDMQQDSKNTDIQQSVNTDTRQINNEISNGNKTSGGKKSKKNKKKKNRQQQQQPASSPSAKDYNVDYYMAEQQQQRNQSLPCKNSTTPPFTHSSSSQEDDDDDLPSSPSDYTNTASHDSMKKVPPHLSGLMLEKLTPNLVD